MLRQCDAEEVEKGGATQVFTGVTGGVEVFTKGSVPRDS